MSLSVRQRGYICELEFKIYKLVPRLHVENIKYRGLFILLYN